MAKKKAKDDVESRIVPVGIAEPYVKVLVFGRHGQGKTRFAASAPRVLIVDINEKGTRSARQFKGAKVFPVSTWEDIDLIYWYLRNREHKFQSVAIDTITAMQQVCMSHVLGVEADKNPDKDRAMPSKREWGKLAELMRPTILNFRNLPMHVIFTAQERTVGDDDEPTEKVPDLSPGSRGPACGAVSIIGRLYKKEVRVADRKAKKEKHVWEDRMLIGPHEDFPDLKDRSNNLGRIVRKPTMSHVIEAWEKSEEQ